MELIEAMKARHSVRKYLDKPIEAEKAEALQNEIDSINAQSGLDIRLVLDEPKAFSGTLAHYGSFRNCKNYFIISAPKSEDENVGYYGERLVLFAQQLGLNTCWVAATYSKGAVPVSGGEKPRIVIALGYGETQGAPRKSRPMEKLCRVNGEMPKWFKNAMLAAMGAPTAVNQQKFLFILKDGDVVEAKALLSPLAKIDLGIAKYHFEIGAGDHKFTWA